MPNNYKRKSYTLFSLHLVPILIAAFALTAGVSYFVTDNLNRGDTPEVQGKKTEKVNSASDKGNKSSRGTVTAQEHKKVVEDVVENIQEISDVEEAEGNEEVSQELDEIVEETEDAVEDTAEAIEEVEGQPAWKTFLIGPDYKNLGQLRSAIAHNENTVRKLTQTSEKLQNEGSTEAIQAQLQLLVQEREKIVSVITQNESAFSLLGWFTKLITGYTPTPIGGIGGTDTGGDTETDTDTEETTGVGESSPVEEEDSTDQGDSTDTTETGSEPPASEVTVTE